jgi:biotin carboxyl carrier protein
MIIRVKIQDQEYAVEIADLTARPVLATIAGQTFEVWPEEQAALPASSVAAVPVPVHTTEEKPAPKAASPVPAAQNGNSGLTVTAPIPGVIVAIAVKEGQNVTEGQELCTLEAMKMKNAIRSLRAGKIGAVKIAIGDHVRHGQVLLDFSE